MGAVISCDLFVPAALTTEGTPVRGRTLDRRGFRTGRKQAGGWDSHHRRQTRARRRTRHVPPAPPALLQRPRAPRQQRWRPAAQHQQRQRFTLQERVCSDSLCVRAFWRSAPLPLSRHSTSRKGTHLFCRLPGCIYLEAMRPSGDAMQTAWQLQIPNITSRGCCHHSVTLQSLLRCRFPKHSP
jgi:hypothetical protein